MTKMVYCGVCGKLLHGIVVHCAYCRIPICRKHNTNNLCPQHVHTMDGKQAKKLNRNFNVSMWVICCALWVGLPTLLTSVFIFIWGEKKYNGAIALGIFALEILFFWLLLRRNNKKHQELKGDAQSFKEHKTKNCPNCNNIIPLEQVICSFCQFDTSRDINQINRQVTITAANDVLQELVDVHKGSDEEVQAYYDKVIDESHRICPHCNRRIESNLEAKNCPYCLKQL